MQIKTFLKRAKSYLIALYLSLFLIFGFQGVSQAQGLGAPEDDRVIGKTEKNEVDALSRNLTGLFAIIIGVGIVLLAFQYQKRKKGH